MNRLNIVEKYWDNSYYLRTIKTFVGLSRSTIVCSSYIGMTQVFKGVLYIRFRNCSEITKAEKYHALANK